jgi:diazepam-binding inhibitor (GABA receptor modulating acyl-CoA-binding protein)
MSELQTRFAAAVDAAADLPGRADNRTLLELYALFHQATEGDSAKRLRLPPELETELQHAAWSKMEGMTPEKAKQRFVELVERLTRVG